MNGSLLIIQGVIPLSLLIWQGTGRSQSQLGWLLKTLAVAGYLSAASLVGMWAVVFLGWVPALYWLVWAAIAVATGLSVRPLPRWPKRPRRGRRHRTEVGKRGQLRQLY